ncbi:MAG: hypothetical protein IJQ74_01100, partial [Synergistaceae bacterium]|nr:hypothetical protein [Synergistaceae bacterium]
MIIENSTAEILELDKNLLPFRERLRGGLGELILDSLRPAENYEALREREKLLREWLDLTDHNGEFSFNAGLEAVSPMFPNAKKSGILSGEELLRVRAVLTCARHIRESLADSAQSYGSVDGLRRGIRDFSPEIESLNVIDDYGRLNDNATQKLAVIREELENLKRNGRRISQKLFEDSDIVNML